MADGHTRVAVLYNERGTYNNFRPEGDGSVSMYLQRSSPGRDKERHWRRAPKSGDNAMTMRLYTPKPEALDGHGKKRFS